MLYFQKYTITRICLLNSLTVCFSTHNTELFLHVFAKIKSTWFFKIFFLILTCYFIFKNFSYNMFLSYFLPNTLRFSLPTIHPISCSLSFSLFLSLSVSLKNNPIQISKWLNYLVILKKSDFVVNIWCYFYALLSLVSVFIHITLRAFKIIFCWFCCCHLFFCFWFMSWEIIF